MNTSNAPTVEVGFTGLLTIAFIVLKLTGVIDWSWWWVLSPLWIGPLIVVVIFAIVALVAVIATAIEENRSK